jgi:CBS domain-containing protein
MRAVDATRKAPVTIAAGASLAEAAGMMDQCVVGALIVVDGERPVGIVTDRDLVVRGLARDVPADARVDAVMTQGIHALDADADVRAALPILRSHAIRRLPVVDDGKVVGMVTTDDLLIDLVADLGDVVRPITGEVVFGYPEPDRAPATTS